MAKKSPTGGVLPGNCTWIDFLNPFSDCYVGATQVNKVKKNLSPSALAGDVGAGLAKGLGALLPAFFSGLGAFLKGLLGNAGKSVRSHAWEWVIGGAMLFVLVGSARRVAEGGQ